MLTLLGSTNFGIEYTNDGVEISQRNAPENKITIPDHAFNELYLLMQEYKNYKRK